MTRDELTKRIVKILKDKDAPYPYLTASEIVQCLELMDVLKEVEDEV